MAKLLKIRGPEDLAHVKADWRVVPIGTALFRIYKRAGSTQRIGMSSVSMVPPARALITISSHRTFRAEASCTPPVQSKRLSPNSFRRAGLLTCIRTRPGSWASAWLTR